MPVTSPRVNFRLLRTVPLEWEDGQDLLLALAVRQLQERSLQHPLEVVAVTANYTALDIDGLILADATAGDVTITLPTAEAREGRRMEVKKTDASANLVVIDPQGTQTIDGSTTISLTQQYALRGIKSDGTNWWLVSAIGNATAL